MKVVINSCNGGFGLSHEAIMLYAKLKGFKLYPFIDDPYGGAPILVKEGEVVDSYLANYSKLPPDDVGEFKDESYFYVADLRRDDPILVEIVEKLGAGANGDAADLKVVEIPDGIKWEITEYGGSETIEEEHRKWS